MQKLVNKNILIRVDGSHSIGLGHIYRMKALSLLLKEIGSNVAFLTQENETAKNLLETTGLNCYVFRNDSYNWVLKEVVTEQQPDLIIQDLLDTTSESMETLRRLSPAGIINFDDTGAGLIMADVVINGMVFHWGKYTIDMVRTRLFEGPQYMILQPEISQYVYRDKKILDKIENILLVFGGTDTHYVTERALEAINDVDAALNVKVNLGPGTKVTSRLEQAVKAARHRIEVIRFVPSLFKEFYKADLVICGGGTMLYELAALGIPSISIAAEPHEIWNIDYWSKTGTTVSLDWEKELDMTQISETVNCLMHDRRRRARMSEIGKQTMDDQGLTRILNILEDTLN
ncbi:MAG: glycosyltransferase [Desulfobacula sp.]|nr:glycosyltransferase [Desulfobacula sp.]